MNSRKLFNIFLPLLLLSGSACSQKKALMIAEIDYVQKYCGGARPTPEMEAAARTPMPYAGKKVILVSANGYVDSVTTSSKGVIKKKVPVGEYKLYEPWRYYKSTPDGSPKNKFDEACLEQEWKKHFMDISVARKTVRQSSDGPIISGCDWDVPCMNEKHLPPRRD